MRISAGRPRWLVNKLAARVKRPAISATVGVWAVLAVVAGVLAPAVHGAPAPAQAKTKGNLDVVQLKTIRFESGRQDDEGNVVLKGLIEIKYKSTRILAEVVEYNRDTGRGTLSGNVQITQGDTELQAAKVAIDIQAEKLVVDGGARVVQYEAAQGGQTGNPGKSDGKTNARRERFSLTSDKLEYSMSTEDMTATGNVTIKRKQQVITAQKLAYVKKADEVTISGAVHALEENKFDVTTESLRLVVGSGEITFLAPISGDLFFERQEGNAGK